MLFCSFGNVVIVIVIGYWILKFIDEVIWNMIGEEEVNI